MAVRPDPNEINPNDMAAIEFAKKNVGDFKLKSDPDYVVPEDQRINAEMKRREMILLEVEMQCPSKRRENVNHVMRSPPYFACTIVLAKSTIFSLYSLKFI